MQLPFDPYPEIQTERLLLNQISMADDQDLMRLRADERVNRYLSREPMSDLKANQAFIQSILTNIANRTSYYWALRFKPDLRLIGTTCLFGFDAEVDAAELGYELMPEYQRQGLMHEALRSVIHFAQQHMHLQRLDAWIHGQNQASLKLVTTLGFQRDTALEEKHVDLRELETMQIYSLMLNAAAIAERAVIANS